jgi:hypothetical protein
MRTLIRWISPAVALVGLMLVGNVQAGEEKVALDKLPKAVLDAAKAKFPDAELVGGGKEEEDGKVTYEVSLKDKGQKVDVELTADGTILVIEKAISVKNLPKEVAEALEHKHPKATIKRVEEITKQDKIAAYEVLLVTARKKRIWEVTFDPSGKFVKQEEKKAKEKEEKEEKEDKDEKK